MKVILATPLFPPDVGGPARYTIELCKRLSKDHAITVVAYTDVPQALPGTSLYAVKKSWPLPIRLAAYTVKLWIASKDADVLYAQNAMAAGLPAAIVSHLRGIPLMLKFVGDEAWERATQSRHTQKTLEDFLRSPEGGFKTTCFMFVQRWVLRSCAKIATPSRYLGEVIQVAYGLDQQKMMVNYNAADESQQVSTSRVQHQIATAVRLVAWKGVEGIVRALADVRTRVPDARLMIAGSGPERESLESLVHTLDLDEAVTFLGPVSAERVLTLFAESHVCILNSTYEGLPHMALDCFETETPLIATNIPGTNEIILHEKTGLLVEPGNTTQLGHMIERVFSEPAMVERIVHEGAMMLETTFSWKAHIARLEQTWSRLARISSSNN